ncbi:hypothetical protein Sked_06890 [Sanguibacter keddieii DSM 10542]|uniref:Uncharacterized protein n=1 Tax=Sanguibacter keddieii (strain ATCC 51767 / DSM 10542 / NCFB 3025 / ST-74) TaxID=446469 RepID=D1BB83_SANKS|nr:hypothetical protein [Sanguibacter keddieii]ACZ20649.1 hypothetical protein Sked_06890 [Sanguibacter keddieii DSM 10542]
MSENESTAPETEQEPSAGDSTTGVAGLAAPEGEPRSDEETRRARRSEQRRGRALWFVIGVPVVLVAAVVLFFVLRPADADPAASATVTTTLPVPTATSEPLDRADATALVQALPGTVRQFVLTTVEPTDSLEGAVEGWTAAYEGEAVDSQWGTASGTSTGSADTTAAGFTVTVGQWADADRATEAAAGLSADLGEPTSTEDVTVGDDVTGSLSFYGEDGASEGTAVWTNGTVVLRAVGPASEVVNFATGFGL